MKFIEMSGSTLQKIVTDGEIPPEQLAAMGVSESSLIRINLQGDIELRRHERWDVIGGLLGDFQVRVRRETGLDYA